MVRELARTRRRLVRTALVPSRSSRSDSSTGRLLDRQDVAIRYLLTWVLVFAVGLAFGSSLGSFDALRTLNWEPVDGPLLANMAIHLHWSASVLGGLALASLRLMNDLIVVLWQWTNERGSWHEAPEVLQ